MHVSADAAEWDERYAGSDRIWSGEPNGALVHEVSELPPGRSLDVGCGEGADAVWLAGRGWTVTALDVSRVALDRAATHAAEAGVEVTWLLGGLLDLDLPGEGFDLVSAQYPVLRRTPGNDAERVLLGCVAPGGTLLLVQHDTRDWASAEHEEHIDPDEWVQPHDVSRMLDDRWVIEADELRGRTISGGAGAGHSHDVVLRARRVG
jgi:SAM-dependent methyltransferase